ncbi:uncharacterized protein [Miscanthus floridulus]|uniref:uncharacterized protein isoform X2 n=1 Tax=Miscanthus floridulus TaxID=154761 RepID=UPI00345AECD3
MRPYDIATHCGRPLHRLLELHAHEPQRGQSPRKVIHTVGPKYAVKYHTAAENALSHCYRSCLELLIENGLESIAMGCIYTEAKNYPREPASHVAITYLCVSCSSMPSTGIPRTSCISYGELR